MDYYFCFYMVVAHAAFSRDRDIVAAVFELGLADPFLCLLPYIEVTDAVDDEVLIRQCFDEAMQSIGVFRSKCLELNRALAAVDCGLSPHLAKALDEALAEYDVPF